MRPPCFPRDSTLTMVGSQRASLEAWRQIFNTAYPMKPIECCTRSMSLFWMIETGDQSKIYLARPNWSLGWVKAVGVVDRLYDDGFAQIVVFDVRMRLDVVHEVVSVCHAKTYVHQKSGHESPAVCLLEANLKLPHIQTHIYTLITITMDT